MANISHRKSIEKVKRVSSDEHQPKAIRIVAKCKAARGYMYRDAYNLRGQRHVMEAWPLKQPDWITAKVPASKECVAVDKL